MSAVGRRKGGRVAVPCIPEAVLQAGPEVERKEDCRWLVEVARLPGALAYGATASEAIGDAETPGRRALAGIPGTVSERDGNSTILASDIAVGRTADGSRPIRR